MKNVAALITLIFCVAFVPIQVNAQHASLFIHAVYAGPLDSRTGDFYNIGGGGEAGILAGKSSRRFGGSLGYLKLFADDERNVFGDKTYVPVKLNFRQYLPLNLIFLQADAGIGLVSFQHTDEKQTPFTYDFQAGIKFTAFEAAIGWENFHASEESGWSSWFTVKAGINLGF